VSALVNADRFALLPHPVRPPRNADHDTRRGGRPDRNARSTRSKSGPTRQDGDRHSIDHRRGQRWPTERHIFVSLSPGGQPRQGRLVNLSRHGAGLGVNPWLVMPPGAAVEIWLPEEAESVRALVIHAREGIAGLLWCSHSPGVQRLIDSVWREAVG
jgi:hypothetical protein